MSSNYLKISIVTPSFNQANFLEETIISVLDQNYPNLEYIIIDGGSTDGSVDIIKKYEDKLHYWCSEKDEGMYDAINKGFAKSSGDIMAWLNSDDIYMPWALKVVSQVMQHLSEVEWLSTLMPLHIDHQGVCIAAHKINGYSKKAFMEGYYRPVSMESLAWIPQESSFWRRTLWDKSDQNKFSSFKNAGDYYLWTEFFDKADLYGLNVPIAAFRFHAKQKTNNFDLYRNEITENVNHHISKSVYRKIFRFIYYRVGLCAIPKFNDIFRKFFGYKSKYIFNRQKDLKWMLGDNNFL